MGIKRELDTLKEAAKEVVEPIWLIGLAIAISCLLFFWPVLIYAFFINQGGAISVLGVIITLVMHIISIRYAIIRSHRISEE